MLADQSRWVALAILVAVTAAIDFIYLAPHRGTLPLKFLVPGTIFLLAFQIVPIIYTIEVALSNYSTGHIISKADAIQQIKINSLQQPRERQAVRGGTRARQERQPRPDPARRHERRGLRRHDRMR